MGIYPLLFQYRSVRPHALLEIITPQETEILQLGEQERPKTCDLAKYKAGKKSTLAPRSLYLNLIEKQPWESPPTESCGGVLNGKMRGTKPLGVPVSKSDL